MIRVNNKKMIRHVADVTFNANRMRNIFAIIAIILTTVLFSSLFTIVGSIISSLEESTMRQVGSNTHGGFKYLTLEEYEQLSKHPDIREISYSVVLAVAENNELNKRQTEIRYANDELEANMMFSMPTTGRLPEKNNEIATDTLVLEKLGIPARLGETVELEFSVCGKKYRESFILVGLWQGDIIMNASQVWLNKEYVEEILTKHNLENSDGIIGSINAEVNFNNSWKIESKLQNVIIESGYAIDEIDYGVNWAYAYGDFSLEPSVVLGIISVIGIIIFCGYLMISNVFLISVTKDIHFYGLLKTIGTTGKQIKVLIRRQAIRISIMGIPLGLLLGSFIGCKITPFILNILNTNVIKVSTNLWVFLFSIVFALITVFISINKAVKLAAKVSPIEALRKTENSYNKKKIKRYGKKISLWKMANENIGRNRKKTALVTISLSLSLIILNLSYTMANSFDMNKYLSEMISHDFMIGDVSWFNVYMEYKEQDTLNQKFLEEISKANGIEKMGKIYFSEKVCKLDKHWNDMPSKVSERLEISNDMLNAMKNEIISGNAIYHIYGIEDEIWNDFKVWKGKIDLEKLNTGDYVVVSPYDEEGKLSAYEVGDMIDVFSNNGESRKCEIIAIASIPYNISIQHSHPVDINIFTTADTFLEKVEEKCPMVLTLDVSDEEINNMNEFLENYCEYQNPNMQYASKLTYLAEYEGVQRTYKLVGSVISVVLALIGISNFANTSITSIMARKRELAMLQGIGMTVRQQRRMLIYEGIIYVILTYGITLTLGVVIGKYGLLLMLLESGYYTINFTIIPSVVCLPVLLVISVIIPMLSQKFVNKMSITERLRLGE